MRRQTASLRWPEGRIVARVKGRSILPKAEREVTLEFAHAGETPLTRGTSVSLADIEPELLLLLLLLLGLLLLLVTRRGVVPDKLVERVEFLVAPCARMDALDNIGHDGLPSWDAEYEWSLVTGHLAGGASRKK
jgi:hypothetical protein